MGSVITEPVPQTSVDRYGLSICTATRDGSTRVGSMYIPSRLAAAVPVHFHPLDGGTRFLALFDGYWNQATTGTEPGFYATHTEVAQPAAVMLDAATGDFVPPTNQSGYDMPITALPGLKLVSAASSFAQLVTLCASDDGPVLNLWNITVDYQLQPRGEHRIADIVADGQDVRFDAGVYIDKPWVYLWGRGLTDGRVYTARQRIGVLGEPWHYQSADGWVPLEAMYAAEDPRPATPVLGLTTFGPISTALVDGATYITTVEEWEPDAVAVFSVSRSMGDPWREVSRTTIDTAAHWTGNGLMLQPQVSPHASQVGARAAIPWVRTAHLSEGGEESLLVSWGIFAVPRI